MAEYNVGRPLTADEILRISSAMNAYTNEQNAMLRGVSALTGVTAGTLSSGKGFDTSLRSFSKANDEEIVGTIMSNAANQDFANRRELKIWFDEKGYPPYMWDKVAAEWRKTMGRKESALASQAAQATAEHQKKMRPGLFKKQQLDITAAEKEAVKRRDTKYADDVASQIAMNAYDYVKQGMDSETALETAIDEQRSKWKKGGISGGPDSPFARSAYIDARGKFDKLVKGEEAPVQVYDTREGELRFMPPTEIAAINEEAPGTILPPGEKPADVTPTSAMKTQMEYRSLLRVGKDTGLTFAQMDEDQQTEAKQNYLSLTHLIKQGQRQNVLLQQITGAPLMKAVKDDITMLVQIEDPEFFQRVFGVSNQYALKRGFEKDVADTEQGFKDAGKKGRGLEAAMDNFIAEWIQEAVNSSGWDEDHIRTMIFPERYAVGK